MTQPCARPELLQRQDQVLERLFWAQASRGRAQAGGRRRGSGLHGGLGRHGRVPGMSAAGALYEFRKPRHQTSQRRASLFARRGQAPFQWRRLSPASRRRAVREGRLRAGDELEQAGLAVSRSPCARAGRRRRSRSGSLDALAPAAELARQCRVVAAEVAGLVLLVAELHVRDLDRHGRVVEHDGADRDAGSAPPSRSRGRSCRRRRRP